MPCIAGRGVTVNSAGIRFEQEQTDISPRTWVVRGIQNRRCRSVVPVNTKRTRRFLLGQNIDVALLRCVVTYRLRVASRAMEGRANADASRWWVPLNDITRTGFWYEQTERHGTPCWVLHPAFGT